ncbi:MAG: UvrB/UvrC motif-containing protein [Elusimicrobia bacterium]|nr:UvrB/UvrC motif-containing protein [Elusimicrobiota bacterium]
MKAVQELEEFQQKANTEGLSLLREQTARLLTSEKLPDMILEIESQMKQSAENLDFETAAVLRDQLYELREMAAQGKTGKKK